MSFLTILPMAVVMVAGTQLVAAVFLASGDRPRSASLGYLAGAAFVVVPGTTAAWLVTRGVKTSVGGGDGGGRSPVETTIDWIVLVLLVVLAVVVFVRRRRAGQPGWMGKLRHATAGYAFRLALLLFVAMPADDITMVTVGASAARHDLPWWHLLPFMLLTLLLLALPLLALVLLGQRAERVLPRIRDWADHHSWIVSEVVVVFFILVTVADLLT
ncbi:GAP family protein [Micromonospora coxensis]|uniref:MYXO-CTERM domain-containing protein n=1 Tax=Micromonospora coxensis TaxID=356852 RepID=A0A1C5IRU4_9ACTN|nr:GAP family protein [Micromonospora coxensis]SCG60699.1 MYXO-CTERM domain-containing protein [Micromonospora coxensis]